jgi:hypothetical protein
MLIYETTQVVERCTSLNVSLKDQDRLSYNQFMDNSEIVNIFRTTKIPATHISQNHLDALHTILDTFTELNKEYTWHYIIADNRKIESIRAAAYINKHQPKTLHYLVVSKQSNRELLITIDNGITLNMKNGTYLLYGLYAIINDSFESIKVPHVIVILRRWWLINTLLAGWLIPVLLFLIFHNNEGGILWLIIFPLGLIMLMGAILNEKDNFLEKLEWDDVVLSTKIQYKTYHAKVGSPILSLLASTKTMISIAASLATILSFIFYLAQH